MGVLLQHGLLGLKDNHPEVVAGVRGLGLMLGLALNVPVADFRRRRAAGEDPDHSGRRECRAPAARRSSSSPKT